MEYHQLQKLLSVEFHRDQYLAIPKRIRLAPGKVMINSVTNSWTALRFPQCRPVNCRKMKTVELKRVPPQFQIFTINDIRYCYHGYQIPKILTEGPIIFD